MATKYSHMGSGNLSAAVEEALQHPSFGRLLRKYREDAGLTQMDLVRELGKMNCPISPSALNNWETGDRLPNDPNVIPMIIKSFNLEKNQATEQLKALILAYAFDHVRRLMDFDGILSPDDADKINDRKDSNNAS